MKLVPSRKGCRVEMDDQDILDYTDTMTDLEYVELVKKMKKHRCIECGAMLYNEIFKCMCVRDE